MKRIFFIDHLMAERNLSKYEDLLLTSESVLNQQQQDILSDEQAAKDHIETVASDTRSMVRGLVGLSKNTYKDGDVDVHTAAIQERMDTVNDMRSELQKLQDLRSKLVEKAKELREVEGAQQVTAQEQAQKIDDQLPELDESVESLREEIRSAEYNLGVHTDNVREWREPTDIVPFSLEQIQLLHPDASAEELRLIIKDEIAKIERETEEAEFAELRKMRAQEEKELQEQWLKEKPATEKAVEAFLASYDSAKKELIETVDTILKEDAELVQTLQKLKKQLETLKKGGLIGKLRGVEGKRATLESELQTVEGRLEELNATFKTAKNTLRKTVSFINWNRNSSDSLLAVTEDIEGNPLGNIVLSVQRRSAKSFDDRHALVERIRAHIPAYRVLHEQEDRMQSMKSPNELYNVQNELFIQKNRK